MCFSSALSSGLPGNEPPCIALPLCLSFCLVDWGRWWAGKPCPVNPSLFEPHVMSFKYTSVQVTEADRG